MPENMEGGLRFYNRQHLHPPEVAYVQNHAGRGSHLRSKIYSERGSCAELQTMSA